MRSFFGVLGRVGSFVLRLRVLRPLLVLAVLVWGLDGLVRIATDAQWFASVGKSELWRQEFAWRAGLQGTFLLVFLALSVGVMRVLAHPVAAGESEPPLPRAMQRWQPLRARISRWGWLALLVASFLLCRGIGNHWSDLALWGGHGDSGTAERFWQFKAPFIAVALAAFWKFALVLSGVALIVGALRALPFLAARPSIRPMRWLRILGVLGSLLAVLRALGFVQEAAWHAQVANENELARTLFVALGGAGALGCLGLVLMLRRPRFQLALWTAAVLLVPVLGGDAVGLFAGRDINGPLTPAPVVLRDQEPAIIPLGDSVTFLRLSRLNLGRDTDGRSVVWEGAGLSTTNAGTGIRADVVGGRLVTDDWLAHGIADNRGDLTWKSLDLPAFSASRRQPLGPLFYGLDGRPLLSDRGDSGGVAIGSWLQKLAWSWRLRDPLLLFDSARSDRLLVQRGAREIGHQLAPFLSWGTATPHRDQETGAAYFECVGYASSANFPRRAAFTSGAFAGQNAVYPVAVLRVDARTGEIRFAPFLGDDTSDNAVVRRLRSALPVLFGSAPSQRAPAVALQTSLAAGSPLVWARTDATQDWEKRALPSDLQLQVRDKIAEFGAVSQTRSLSGATPVLWRQSGRLWLAQSFFPSTVVAQGETSAAPTNTLQLQPKGVTFGPLGERGLGWGATLAEARAALGTKDVAPIQQPKGTGTPPSLQTLVQSALRAQTASDEALRKGRYVEAARQSERAKALLQELTRRAR